MHAPSGAVVALAPRANKELPKVDFRKLSIHHAKLAAIAAQDMHRTHLEPDDVDLFASMAQAHALVSLACTGLVPPVRTHRSVDLSGPKAGE